MFLVWESVGMRRWTAAMWKPVGFRSRKERWQEERRARGSNNHLGVDLGGLVSGGGGGVA